MTCLYSDQSNRDTPLADDAILRVAWHATSCSDGDITALCVAGRCDCTPAMGDERIDHVTVDEADIETWRADELADYLADYEGRRGAFVLDETTGGHTLWLAAIARA